MCAALVHNPPVLVIDEPMVGLDPRAARLLKNTFQQKAREGLTIFMSTHSLSVAQEVADKLAIIRRGKILAMGTVDDLISQARTENSDLEEAFLKILDEADQEDPVSEELSAE